MPNESSRVEQHRHAVAGTYSSGWFEAAMFDAKQQDEALASEETSRMQSIRWLMEEAKSLANNSSAQR